MSKLTQLTCEYIESPILIDTQIPRFAWALKGEEMQKQYRIKVDGPHGTVWDSGEVCSAVSVHIEYSGSLLSPFTTYHWSLWVKTGSGQLLKEKSMFRTGAMDVANWNAVWIGKKHKGPVYFKKMFDLENVPEEVYLYASAYGVYGFRINGRSISNSYLNPGWTDYRKRIQYQVYDVTGLLKQGENIMEAVVADGWYCGNIAIAGREMYGTYPLYLFAELRGNNLLVTTDHTWQASAGSLIRSDLQTGDEIDYRIGYDWQPVDTTRNDLTQRLSAQIGPLIEKQRTLHPKYIGKHGSSYLYDFGQNFTGWVRIKYSGISGQAVTVRHGEMLIEEGALYTKNLRTARQTDVYVLDGQEHFLEPLFTYHGFRYIEVTGVDELSEDAITGICIYAALPETMEFVCPDSLVNRLCQNALWSQRGNFFSVPTDCPQRDERMGWTGDVTAFCRSACYHMNCVSYFEKYLQDMEDAQRENGAITDVVPDVFLPDGKYLVGAGNPAWGDAAFILTYTLYHVYGNRRAIERYFPMLERYMVYLASTTTNHIRPGQHYGDWLSVEAETSKELLGTAFYAYASMLMTELAEIMGKTKEQMYYQELFYEIRNAFRTRFVLADGKLESDTQTAYLVAIRFRLLNHEEEKKAGMHLVQNIEAHNYHPTTGFVGVTHLLPVLSDIGREDIATRLLKQTTYPSWLYPVLNGATTIWERWNSYTYENGFGDAEMNSFNHYSLGSVVEWLYSYAAGIQLKRDMNGLPVLTIKPMLNIFPWLKATYKSICGGVSVCWDEHLLTVAVPANHTAIISLPNEFETTINGGVHHFSITQSLNHTKLR